MKTRAYPLLLVLFLLSCSKEGVTTGTATNSLGTNSTFTEARIGSGGFGRKLQDGETIQNIPNDRIEPIEDKVSKTGGTDTHLNCSEVNILGHWSQDRLHTSIIEATETGFKGKDIEADGNCFGDKSIDTETFIRIEFDRDNCLLTQTIVKKQRVTASGKDKTVDQLQYSTEPETFKIVGYSTGEGETAQRTLEITSCIDRFCSALDDTRSFKLVEFKKKRGIR